jgi:hypothetical protein
LSQEENTPTLGEQISNLSIQFGNVVDNSNVSFNVLFNALANVVVVYTMEFISQSTGALNEEGLQKGLDAFTNAINGVAQERFNSVMAAQAGQMLAAANDEA